jgi:hypothetical protein
LGLARGVRVQKVVAQVFDSVVAKEVSVEAPINILYLEISEYNNLSEISNSCRKRNVVANRNKQI